jgi:hypothetical protein
MLHNLGNLILVGSSPLLLDACAKPEFKCDDVSGLGEEDAQLRSSLEYQDRSPFGETKSCSTCAFYKAGKKNECGQCTLLKGPIHPLGHCNSWAAKV